LLGRTEENFETTVKIVSVLAEVQMEHLLNMNLKHYCYTDVLSVKQFLNGGKINAESIDFASFKFNGK
jgi:hypothetical protein